MIQVKNDSSAEAQLLRAQQLYRNEEERLAKTEGLTVEQALAVRAEFAHELVVRAVGPAVILVLELGAPLRMEHIASTDSEFDALLEHTRCSPAAGHVLQAFAEAKEVEEGSSDAGLWRREQAHHERLENAQPLSSLRVGW